jgi:hypothetical protein
MLKIAAKPPRSFGSAGFQPAPFGILPNSLNVHSAFSFQCPHQPSLSTPSSIEERSKVRSRNFLHEVTFSTRCNVPLSVFSVFWQTQSNRWIHARLRPRAAASHQVPVNRIFGSAGFQPAPFSILPDSLKCRFFISHSSRVCNCASSNGLRTPIPGRLST